MYRTRVDTLLSSSFGCSDAGLIVEKERPTVNEQSRGHRYDYECARLLGTVNRFECFAAKRGNKVGPKYRARNDNDKRPLRKVAHQLPMKGLSVMPSFDYHFPKHAEMPHLYFLCLKSRSNRVSQ